MKLQTFPTSLVAAFLIGVVQTYFITLCWVYIAIYTPLPHWLIGNNVTGRAFDAALFSSDFVVNVLLCIPAAFLLCKLRPRKLWSYLVLAVLPGFFWQYRHLLGGESLPLKWSLYLPGALSALFMLPVATLVVRLFSSRGAPNNSFKPKPLRGSA